MPYFYGTFLRRLTILKEKMIILWGQNNHLVGRK